MGSNCHKLEEDPIHEIKFETEIESVRIAFFLRQEVMTFNPKLMSVLFHIKYMELL